MIQILALEPDASQAEALRRALADSKIDLRVVTDPEVAVAEINRLVPDAVLVGRSVPTGRRDAVATHAKKAGQGAALVVLEIPSFRTDGPQERRFLKFGFKKAPAAGEKMDPAVFVEKLIALLPKRSESRGRAKAGHADGTRKRHAAEAAHPERSHSAPPAEAVPTVATPEPVPAPEPVSRETDPRLLAEVERVRAELSEQYQQEMAALAREATILRDQAVTQAVADAEAHARAMVAVEVTRVRAETDETLSIELARARAEAAHALDIEVTRVRAEHDSLIGELVERALQRELERAHAEHQSRWEAERAAVIAAAVDQASTHATSDHDTIRQEADARVAAALRDLQSAEEAAATLRAALSQAKAEAHDLRQGTDARLTAALRDVQSAEEAAAALQAALGQAQAEGEELRDARDQALREAELARRTAQEETRAACERAAAEALEVAVAHARTELETELAAERERKELARAGHERALADAQERLAAQQADARQRETDVAGLTAQLEALLAERAAEADGHVTRLRNVEAQKDAAIAQAMQEVRAEVEAETLRLVQEEAARGEIARATAQRDLEARVEAEIARVRDEESGRAAAAVATALQEADERRAAAVAAAQQDADIRQTAAIAAAWQEADALQAAAVAAALREADALQAAAVAAALQEADALHAAAVASAWQEADVRQAAAIEQAHAAQIPLQEELASTRREVEELRAAQAAARAGAGDSKRGKAARAEAVREEAARLAAEIEARFTLELAEVRNDAAHARTALEQAQYHRDLERQAADAARQELTRIQQAAETHVTELSRTREEAARVQEALERTERDRADVESALKQAANAARQELTRIQQAAETHVTELSRTREDVARVQEALDRTERDRADVESALKQAEHDRDSARQTLAQAVHAEAVRVQAETEARLADAMARAHDEVARAHAAEQQAERTHETARHVAEQALQAEVARVRAEAEAQLEIEVARVREEVTAARRAEQQARNDLEVFRERTSRDGRVATESAAALMLQEEVARVRTETEANLAEDIARMRKEIERTHAALHETQRELDQARKAQLLPVAPPPAGEPFRARAASNNWAAPGDSDRFVGGSRFGRSRWARAGLGAVAALVLLGAGVSIGLPRLAWQSLQSITVADPAPESATPPVTDAEATGRGRRGGRGTARPSPSGATSVDPAGSGFVNVFSRIPLEVFLGARRVGSSEDERLLLAPGRHRLRIVNRHFKFEGTVEVDVTAGALTSHSVTLPTAPLRITAPEGAEVYVEDQFAGVAPVPSIAVPIGTREVRVSHPARGEKKQSVEVRHGEATAITVDLDTAPPTGADAVGLPPVMPSSPPPGNP